LGEAVFPETGAAVLFSKPPCPETGGNDFPPEKPGRETAPIAFLEGEAVCRRLQTVAA
jgi:hypothetical protein